ncbi:hypothetical protein [Antarcticirhabdus aurantiaca]|uniref:Uncharacterized protein n=1 Tax=Antarcticirhabdus aurantiaca TaxID=2606717 RepID=A0ACD4NV82_9HYPH|nr:hypothetical protein [Antarcticirhabdus aurantiaca]WAJ30507.1 hypothetical protein OXU80_10010 [Jeongeuplla avenae]
MLASAGIDAARTAGKFEETSTRADAERLEAGAEQNEAMMQMLDDMIDQALSRLMAPRGRFDAVFDTIVEAVQDRGNTLPRAQFRG